jgi:hypothetical protein
VTHVVVDRACAPQGRIANIYAAAEHPGRCESSGLLPALTCDRLASAVIVELATNQGTAKHPSHNRIGRHGPRSSKNLLSRNISQDSNTSKTLQRKYIYLTSTGTTHRLYLHAEVERAVDLRLPRSELLSVVGGTFPKARTCISN